MINGDLRATETATEATEEQYDLFNRYQRSRHGGGEMSRMDYYDYQSLVEDTPVQSCLVEFRDANDTLLAACLIDHLSDGLSAVYSFFDPDQPRRSLGTLMVLWLVEEARRRRLPYVYLGFWIADCRKMAYKGRFQPLEAYTPDGWQRIDPDDPETTRHFCAGL